MGRGTGKKLKVINFTTFILDLINFRRCHERLKGIGVEMTNKEILQIAMQQSAVDMSCNQEDYEKEENVVAISKNSPECRKYLELPFYCDLVSYGNNIVASVSPEIKEIVEAYINKYPVEHCFKTPNLHVLNDALQEQDMRICFMAEYFLPDLDSLHKIDCEYTLKVLVQCDFENLYTPLWSNALCEKRKQLDVLGIGAYDGDKLIGLAGCSADCETMWQIGVDVLPEYRRKGIAAALTSRLAFEILERNKVPFYCAAWSNMKSVRNAIKSGFRPAWVEVTAKSRKTVDQMNMI